MNFQDAEINLLYLGNAEFTVYSKVAINDELKTEILNKVFPSGSKWRLYTGIRSIAFFPLRATKNKFALCYSIIVNIIDMPIISFVAIVGNYRSQLILSHGLRGIENTFLRKLSVFVELKDQLANVLKENIVSYKSFANYKGNKNVARQTKRNQIFFVSSYTSPSQWVEVETSIVKNAFSSTKVNISSFRSFTLNQETDFEFLGLVQE